MRSCLRLFSSSFQRHSKNMSFISSRLQFGFQRFFAAVPAHQPASKDLNPFDAEICSPFTCSRSAEPLEPTPLQNRNAIKLPIKKVVMIRKITLLEQIHDDSASKDNPQPRAEDSQVQQAHQDTLITVEAVERELRSRNLEVLMRYRAKQEDIKWADLIVSVGGDGTFLTAAHQIEEGDMTPVLAVNSSPTSSYGYFCAADRNTFPAWLSAICEGVVGTSSLYRMQVFRNHALLPVRVINDCLFAAETAACTSRYQIAYGNHAQVQKSSGVWVATPAGSTAAIRSAGGVIEPLHNKRLQFLVRELFPASVVGEPIRHGFVERQNQLRIVSRIANAKLFLDGHRLSEDVSYGDVVSFAPSVHPLEWVRPAVVPDWLRGVAQ